MPPSPRPALPTFWKPLRSLPGFLQPRRSPAFAFKRGVSQRSKPSVRGKWRTTINRTTKQNKQNKTLFCQCISDILSTVCASGASSLRSQTRKESVQGRTRRMRDWEELPYKGNPTDQDSTTSRRGSSEGIHSHLIVSAKQAKWLSPSKRISSITRGWRRPKGILPTAKLTLPRVTGTLEGKGYLICYLADFCCIVCSAGPLIFIILERKMRSLFLMGWLNILEQKQLTTGMSFWEGWELRMLHLERKLSK